MKFEGLESRLELVVRNHLILHGKFPDEIVLKRVGKTSAFNIHVKVEK